MRVMLRVRMDSRDEHGNIRKMKITENGKQKEIEMVGGVVEDNIGEILGYVYNEDLYDRNMKRKKEHYIPYNW